jgi:hypothetical protein
VLTAHAALVEVESTCLHQPQRRDGSDGLGHRLDPHDGVLGHRGPADRDRADRDHLDRTRCTERSHRTWNRAGFDVTL